MEVKDVNIGNWILDPYLRHSEVRRIELVAEGSFIWVLVDGFTQKYQSKHCQGIPLIPDWFEGFEDRTDIRYGNGYDYQPKDNKTTTVKYELGSEAVLCFSTWEYKGRIENTIYFESYCEHVADIQYLHQLQQLVNVIHGFHLELSPPGNVLYNLIPGVIDTTVSTTEDENQP